MSSAPRWRRLPEERPQQIIKAALEIFDEFGLAGARLEDIAKRAGVSKGTIYLYFPNKEELFRAVVRWCVVEALSYGEHIPPDASAAKQLRRFMEGFWHFMQSPTYITISRLVTGDLPPELAKFYANDVILRTRRLIARIIKRGIASGEFRKVDPMVTAQMLTALFGGKAVWCRKRHLFTHMEQFTDKEVFEQLVDFYSHALHPCPSA